MRPEYAKQNSREAYAFHANSYLVKPANFDQFGELIEALGCYWLLWNQHPA